MADFIKDEDNSEACLSAVKAAVARALEIIGEKAEGYAVALAAPRGPKDGAFPGDLTGQIRNSIGQEPTECVLLRFPTVASPS